MRTRLGVDIGGTFTDLVLSRDGETRSWKVPSTPPDFEHGVLDGIATVAGDLGLSAGAFLSQLDELVHGTTVTTNIVLTRTGARVGLLTTLGFGDLYELARQYRDSEQDPSRVTHARPLVPRGDIEEVSERVDFQGRVVLGVDADGPAPLGRPARRRGHPLVRGVLPVGVPQPGARAGGARGDPRAGAGRVRHALARGVPADRRVRADEHDGDHRLRRPGAARLRDAPPGRGWARRASAGRCC